MSETKVNAAGKTLQAMAAPPQKIVPFETSVPSPGFPETSSPYLERTGRTRPSGRYLSRIGRESRAGGALKMVRGFKGGCFFRWGKQAPPETRRGAPAFYSPSPGPKRGRPPPSPVAGGKNRKGRPRPGGCSAAPPKVAVPEKVETPARTTGELRSSFIALPNRRVRKEKMV